MALQELLNSNTVDDEVKFEENEHTEESKDQSTEELEKKSDNESEEKKVEDIDWSKVDAATLPHDKVAQSPAFQGVVNELREQRQTNKDLTAAALSGKSKDGDDEVDEDAVDDIEDDEPMSKAEVRAYMARQEAKRDKVQQEEQQKKTQQEQTDRENTSIEALKETHTVENSGKGLDALAVLGEGLPWLQQNKPAILAAALLSKDPAKELYDLSTMYCPAIRERFDTRRNDMLLSKISSGKNDSGGGRQDELEPVSDIMKLIDSSEEELMAGIEKDLDGG